jgi:Flp pilus assembly protein TadG
MSMAMGGDMLSRHRGFLTNARREKGSVLLMCALAMPVLIGLAGLALDAGTMYVERRNMQTAADAGALGGASEIYRQQFSLVTSSAQAATTANGFTDGTNGVTVTVNRPQASGYYTGNLEYVEVLINQPSPTYFRRFLGTRPWTVPARAVAGVGANGKNCIYALDPVADAALQVQASANLTANCGVIVDSTSYRALYTQSAATLTATEVSVTGNYQSESASVVQRPNPYKHLLIRHLLKRLLR